MPLRLISATPAVRGLDELSDEIVREKERRTRGESSASTLRARKAENAKRWVGRGRVMVLGQSIFVLMRSLDGARTHNAQGKASS